jgi:ABC transport system ATP-binding/permease protein
LSIVYREKPVPTFSHDALEFRRMAPPLLTLQDIKLTLGGTPLFELAALSVSQGERLCLVGRNGSGKSTLLKIAAGLIEPDDGQRFLQPDARVFYLPQEPDFTGFKTALDYIRAGLGPSDDPHRAKTLLNDLGLSGEEDPAQLSGGEARRVALVRVIAPEPDILLLDEPTNHLDLPAIEWFEDELARLRSALVLISHDRRFLAKLSRKTVWLDRGRTRNLDRGFAEFETWRDDMLEEEEAREHKLERKIAAEEHWLRYGVTARRKRNQRRLAALVGMRREHREHRRAQGNVKLSATEGEAAGKLVIEAKGLVKSFGERPIVAGFSIRVFRGDRLGIVGANGAGKTTLIKLLTGELPPDAGLVRLGANIEIASLDQKRAHLDPQTALKDALTGGGSDYVDVAGSRKHVMGYMRDFLFGPEQARTPIGKLSGGERGRLMLARALAAPASLLVLDEPTNDLDLETLDLLQEMLADYAGTLILVSHDRDFLDRVATSIVIAEGGGRWIEYAGGYSDMLAQRGTDLRREPAKAPAAIEKKDAEKDIKPAPSAEPKRRLSFNEKHALETLPKTIARLQADIEKHRLMLDDSDLYNKDRTKFDRASAALTKAQQELQEAEDRWLELEMLREEIEQA